jgi:mycothiol synthase
LAAVDTITIRAFTLADMGRTASFLRQVHQLDERVDGPEDDAFKVFVDLPSNEGGRWFAIAETGFGIAAVLLSGLYHVTDRPVPIRAFRIFVAPQYRGQGLGSRLLSYLESENPEEQVVYRTVVAGDWPAGRGLLERRGFSRSQETLILRRSGLPPKVPSLMAGYVIRDANIEMDGDLIARLYNVAHRRSFGFAPISVGELRQSLGAPGGRLLALDSPDGQLIGSVQTLPYFNGVGVIHAIQIAPDYQRKGLGRFLLLAAINALAQQGFRTVELTVDRRNTEAIRLYDSSGFIDWRRDLTYERLITS